MRAHIATLCLLAIITCASPSRADDDAEYTAKIRQFTTEKFFLTELIDHLPASATVPSPLKTLGYIAGDTQRLTYSQDLHRYYRELAKASPRVHVFTAPEKSEEGREQLLVVISDEANLAKLEHYKEIAGRLADPRKLSDDAAQGLVREGLPFYWASGSIHSTETGSPEMLMELAYRLAVEETPFIQTIRKNSIVMITPVLEVDGHDRQVDIVNFHRANPDKALPPLVYWGKYVGHDNNRDALGMGLALSRNQMRTFLEYHPQVLHDLHESIPYLYISTGTGPYNAWLDPIVVDEWHQLAYNEVGELTRRGVPGVWTHGFYDGWASNYMFFVAQGHNAIGRFYETMGHTIPDTMEEKVGEESQRAWYRPNPPLAKVKWSLRNNVNLQQSGILLGMNYVASNRERFLNNFYLKSLRAIKKAETEGPAAYVIPGDTTRALAAADMVNKLREQGVEVHVTSKPFTVKPPEKEEATAPKDGSKPGEKPEPKDVVFPAGSYVVRMDQPYSRMADNLLDTQYYNPSDPTPYDDTGWTTGALRNVKTVRVSDKNILATPMTLLTEDARVSGGVEGAADAGAYLIDNNAESALMTFRYQLKDVAMKAAEQPFTAGGRSYRAGTMVIPAKGGDEQRRKIDSAARELGVKVTAVQRVPDVKAHDIGTPRIALVHTWTDTQNEGWYRLELDRLHIPYSYISTHTLRDAPNLRRKFDVILFPPAFVGPDEMVHGAYKGDSPVPWKGSKLMPNVAMSADQTDDMRGGMEFSGLANVQRFVEEGGLFIGIGATSRMPISFGMVSNVSVEDSRQLKTQGSIFLAKFASHTSPVAYGYDETVPIYVSRPPLFRVAKLSEMTGMFQPPAGPRPSGRGGASDPDVVQGRPLPPEEKKPKPAKDAPPEEDVNEEDQTPLERLLAQPYTTPKAQRPRVILRFSEDPKSLLISGMLAGESELVNRPAIVDVPSGKGHFLLFANNPIWRHNTQGSFALLFNAILNFDHL
jgi:hypothetical protein